MKNCLAIIGDIHGKKDIHENIMREYEYTLQIGDLGFDYSYLDSYDSSKHMFFPGNHDD
jgi:hypothetical protein